MPRSSIVLLGLVGGLACSGDSGSDVTDPGSREGSPNPPSSEGVAPSRIDFQHPVGGFEYDVGSFEENVPLAPGFRYLVRAVPTDAAGHVYANLTLNWSVAGGGSLDHAVTSAGGGNDATLNGWTVGTQDGIESITVSPAAHPSVVGVLHVRVVHVHVVAVTPPNSNSLTLGVGSKHPLPHSC